MNALEYNDVTALNSFLRGELTAVKTYEQCIAHVADAHTVFQLRMLQASHNHRAKALRKRIQALGGEPSADAGVWGGIKQTIQAGAGLFGPGIALTVLEQGEEHGLADYERSVGRLSPLQRAFVETEVLPEQRRSTEILAGIEQSGVNH